MFGGVRYDWVFSVPSVTPWLFFTTETQRPREFCTSVVAGRQSLCVRAAELTRRGFIIVLSLRLLRSIRFCISIFTAENADSTLRCDGQWHDRSLVPQFKVRCCKRQFKPRTRPNTRKENELNGQRRSAVAMNRFRSILVPRGSRISRFHLLSPAKLYQCSRKLTQRSQRSPRKWWNGQKQEPIVHLSFEELFFRADVPHPMRPWRTLCGTLLFELNGYG